MTERSIDLALVLPRESECAGCVDEVGRELLRLEGVDAVEPDITRGLIRVRHDEDLLTGDDVVRLARRIGTATHCEDHCPLAVHDHGPLDLAALDSAPRERRLLHVTGMDCADCALKLQSALRKEDGVEAADVNFGAATLSIVIDPSVTGLDSVFRSVRRLGYDTVERSAVEAGDANPATPPIDTDSDGTPDFLSVDSDGDTIADRDETGPDPQNPLDTDGDTLPDYRDTESDGDGIPDAVEAGDARTGPLLLYPGSHRLPLWRFDGGHWLWPHGEDRREIERHCRLWAQRCRDAGLVGRAFTAQAGDLVVMHPRLAHAAAPALEPGLTRRSIVLHFAAADAYGADHRPLPAGSRLVEVGGVQFFQPHEA